ncbi:MAG: hypothetical protein SGARI_005272, partial [Bacillariaceae sp.]
MKLSLAFLLLPLLSIAAAGNKDASKRELRTPSSSYNPRRRLSPKSEKSKSRSSSDDENCDEAIAPLTCGANEPTSTVKTITECYGPPITEPGLYTMDSDLICPDDADPQEAAIVLLGGDDSDS